uniref:Saposin B-type domain-containing protein n=1 Tax=Arion vulgaris TaxID=1028688 RepID=A0A0B6ZTZ3_9EUPU
MMGPLTVGVVIFLTLASADPISVAKSSIQRDYCSWGAQYWCSSPQTAGICGKTEWCTKNDWPYDVVQDSSCTVAQKLIKNARDFIRDSAQKPISDQDFARFIAMGCAVFKDRAARLQCKEIATKEAVILKLVKLVDSQLSVQSVAVAVGVCKKNIPKEEGCLRCIDVVPTAQKYISKFLTEENYLKLIEPLCVKLGQGHQLCQVIGQAKYKDFYNALISAPAQPLCQGSTSCLTAGTSLQKVQASTKCEACRVVVNEIRQLDRNQNVQVDIQNLFKSVCFKLGEFEQLCEQLADEALEYAFELIATEMEPDVVCEELKLCAPSEQKAVQHQSPADAVSVECSICEYLLRGIDLAIVSNFTAEKVQTFLNDICNRLPSPFSTECTNFVAQHYSEIIQLLLIMLIHRKCAQC